MPNPPAPRKRENPNCPLQAHPRIMDFNGQDFVCLDVECGGMTPLWGCDMSRVGKMRS